VPGYLLRQHRAEQRVRAVVVLLDDVPLVVPVVGHELAQDDAEMNYIIRNVSLVNSSDEVGL